ncbi:MAG: glycoside hydrolase family 15 protein [Ignavibacteriaceae bacterium]
MKRREFMMKSTLSALAVAQLRPSIPSFLSGKFGTEEKGKSQQVQKLLASSWATDAPFNENMNVDYISYLPGVEYFLMGNGDLQAVVQYCKDCTELGKGSFFGLTIMSAEHFSQKWSTFLYSSGHGFGNTLTSLGIDGMFYGLTPSSLKSIGWKYIDHVPVVSVIWRVSDCEMEEQLFVPSEGPLLFRRIHVRNLDVNAHKIELGLTLYPNIALFDNVYTDEHNMTANAEGFTTLRMLCMEKNVQTLGRYTLRTERGMIAPGQETEANFVYFLKEGEPILKKKDFKTFRSETVGYWKDKNSISTSKPNLDHVWNLSKTGLKAHVARSGKRDSGIWEYGMEWVRDDVMVMTGFLQSGFFLEAKTLLERMFEKFVTDDGRTVESSQVFGLSFTEIDQNGELLYGTWAYLCWTGDYKTVRKYWHKIIVVAELPLKSFFWQPDSGLLNNTREFWERSDSFGVKPGYEIAYQFWVIFGLEKASELAARLNQHHYAAKWRSASEKIKNAMLNNSKFRLIEDGHFIKRRTLNGEWQKTIIPPNRKNMPAGTPIAVEKTPRTEPDTSEVLPIMYEMIEPKSELALKTLEWVEPLWNERWNMGGYERYSSSSEPEPPGPWPFPSLFVAQAYWEAGNFEKGMRVIDWLSAVNGGLSGGWFEYYPNDHPTVGIVGWNWAEVVRFVVDHILGVRPQLDKLVIRPRLGADIDAVKSQVKVRDMSLDMTITLSGDESIATVNKKTIALHDGQLILPYQRGSKLTIDINLKK